MKLIKERKKIIKINSGTAAAAKSNKRIATAKGAAKKMQFKTNAGASKYATSVN